MESEGETVKRAAAKVAKEIAGFLNGKGDAPAIPYQTLQSWVVALAAPPRKPRATPTKGRTAIKDLDLLCREIVFLRDKGLCRRCKRPARDWSHVYTRAKYGVRWDLENSFAACRACHHWWHENPIDGARWWKEQIGPRAFDGLVIRSNRKFRPDKEAVRLFLVAQRRAMS